MKLIRVFKDNPTDDEIYINPNKIDRVMICHCEKSDTEFYQLWLTIEGDSFLVGNFDSKLAAKELLGDLLEEC